MSAYLFGYYLRKLTNNKEIPIYIGSYGNGTKINDLIKQLEKILDNNKQ